MADEPRRLSDAALDAMAAITEDFCPPHPEYLALVAQAKDANRLERVIDRAYNSLHAESPAGCGGGALAHLPVGGVDCELLVQDAVEALLTAGARQRWLAKHRPAKEQADAAD